MNDYSIGQIKELARKQLHGQWSKVVPVFFLYTLLVGIPNGILGVQGNEDQIANFMGQVNPLIITAISIYTFLVAGPFAVGISTISLRILRNRQYGAGTLFEGFNRFGTAFCTYLFVLVFSLLWILLFMIVPAALFAFGTVAGGLSPGVLAIAGVGMFVMFIVAAIFIMRYQMAYFLVSDYPELRARQCIRKSVEMMRGNVKKLFLLNLSFIGWALLVGLIMMLGTTALVSMFSLFSVFLATACWAVAAIGFTVLFTYISVSQGVFYSIRSGNMINQYNGPGFEGIAENNIHFNNDENDRPTELEGMMDSDDEGNTAEDEMES